MVTISNARTLQGDNGPFVVLDLDGDPEVRISQNTGKAYLTASRATILCTLKPEIAEKLIGKELPGMIKRVEVEPFSWVDKRTGEEKVLTHRSVYVPESEMVQTVMQN